MAETLYLIDGHAQLYRAYYAPFRNLTAPSGEPTRATYVFMQMLLNLLRDRTPDYVAMVLDADEGKLLRRQIYPEYKAQREPTPEDFFPQERRVVSLLETARMPILRQVGYEADDIIATLAKRWASPDLDVVIVSRDKDLEQLLGPHVRMYDPLKDDWITAENLKEKKGWTPAQAVEAQVLTGDATDNVPGVPGIGPKTAAKLLEKYGSLAEILAHADELSPKQRENLQAFVPLMETVRALVTLRNDVPIELDLSAAARDKLAWAALRPEFTALGLRRLVEQLPAGEAGAESPPADADADAEATSAAVSQLVADTGPIDHLRVPERGPYALINTPETLTRLAQELATLSEFAVDTETTGTDAIAADLCGISLSWGVGQGCYIPTRCVYGTPLAMDAVRAALGPVFACEKTLKIGQNLKYDMLVLQNAGLPLAGPLFDTMIAAFLLDPLAGSFGLDKLVLRHLGHTMIPITDLIGKGRQQLCIDQVPLEHVTEYAAEDADYTWRLYQLFAPRLKPTGVADLFNNVEMPLVRVLTTMEAHGIALDVPFLEEMSKRLAARLGELVDEVHTLVQTPFNLDSPKQLSEVLFDRLGFRVVRKTKTTRSTDAETLEVLSNETGHPIFKLLLEYRELQKLRGTYVDALPQQICKRTGRVHTSFHQTGAVTGRLSSSDPNLQNIPIRTELGREIRRAFVPRSADERLVVADYSQVELRVLAHFSEDEALAQAFAEERDIHAFVASQVNGVTLEDVTREMRAQAKAVNFGIVYGQTAFGLAQATGMSRADAQAFIDAYFARYPRVRRFIDQVIADAKRVGYVQTILGRRRPIENIDSRNANIRAQAERFAVNTVVQGSAADLIKVAMIQLDERIRQETLPMRMLLQVHDELVCETPAEQAAAAAAVLRDVMCAALPLRVPLKVDVGIGLNWLEAK